MADFHINPSDTAIGTAGDDNFFFDASFANNVSGAGGNDTFTLPIVNSVVHGDAGDDILNSSFASSNVLFGDDGNDFLFVAINGAGSNNSLNGGTGNDWLGAGGSNYTLDGGDGSDWIGVTGNGNTLLGQAGDDQMQIIGTRCFVLGGDGNNSLFAVGTDPDSQNKLSGDAGNDWVGASADRMQLNGGSGDDFVAATGTRNILNGETGNDTLVIGAGSVMSWVLFRPAPVRIVSSALTHPNSNLISIEGFGLADFTQLQPFLQQSGADTVITLNGNDILTLRNVQASALTALDFVFA